MRLSNKLVHGVGIKGMDYSSSVDGELTIEYVTWRSMLLRCTKKFQKDNLSYAGITCSENFKSYSFFYEWCQEQIGFGNKDNNGKKWCLDKDILVKGNKLYSEDTCVFVPERINNLLGSSKAIRGDYLIGVCFDKTANSFKAQCKTGKGTPKNLGRFNTEQEAFQAYKTFKEALIKNTAEAYKNQIDCRVYWALINYEVDNEPNTTT